MPTVVTGSADGLKAAAGPSRRGRYAPVWHRGWSSKNGVQNNEEMESAPEFKVVQDGPHIKMSFDRPFKIYVEGEQPTVVYAIDACQARDRARILRGAPIPATATVERVPDGRDRRSAV